STALLLALATPLALAAPADEADVTSDPFDLRSIVVTATAPVSALNFDTSPKLPRQPVPACDGADYLKTIPGFSAVRNGGTNGDAGVRARFGCRRNMLTVDGAMPAACPSPMDNATSYIAPETYDRLLVT